MPSVAAEPPLSVLSNGANSSFDGPPRKSHDKTIGGVFTYTNGPGVETSSLPDHRLDQLKNFRNNSHSSLANGLPNGTATALKSPRDRSHSKAGSTHSIGSVGQGKDVDNVSRSRTSADGLTKLSSVENATDQDLADGAVVSAPDKQTPDLGQLKTSIPPEHDSSHMVTASTVPDTARSDGLALTPYLSRGGPPPSMSRYSSPPAAAGQDRFPELAQPSEAPKLTHRHTLQVPKSNIATGRTSRDFSFSAGPSEEALSTTGRFSPTRDQYDVNIRHRRASLGLVRRTTRSMQSDSHLNEVPPDEDAARWTELIKQKRASRRKKREEEDDDRVIVGKKVEEGHANWVTAYNMLTGIRFTVSRTNAKMDRELTDADFDAKHKFSFDITGNELTPSAKYDFKFKDYAPWVFRHLRATFGLDPADYLVSLTSKYILSELGSPGKSGSFFYFSRDYKYIIKTIHHAEHKLLRKILRDYYRHVLDNPNTLISQFYGLHRVKIPYGRKIHFVVMNNLFPPHRDIHQMFDLKGSTIGRDFREEDLAKNPRATLKDLNWLRRGLHLEFDARTRQIFLDQLRRDVALLQRLQIMDYSLLVGIHDLGKGNEENLRETTLQVFQPGGERDQDEHSTALLTRTPSRLESARKARELRLTLKKEKPVPMGQASTKMPSELASGDERRDRIFYSYDGGIRATHEDGSGGDKVYYLGVIDCLTHYGFIKRVEHFWKGLSAPRTQISPVPPQAYGERFLNFITGITMTQEEAERRRTLESCRTGERPQTGASVENVGHNVLAGSQQDGSGEKFPPLSPAVEKTMRKALKQADKAMPMEKGRRKSEEEKPERILRTVEEPKSSALLPVVSEAGENGESSEKRMSGYSAEEHGKAPVTTAATTEYPMIPGLRKVSPSTVGTATDMQDHDHDQDQEREQQPEHEQDGRAYVSNPHREDQPSLSPWQQVDGDPRVPSQSRSYTNDEEAADDLEPELESTGGKQQHEYVAKREKPPRLASDLIQPQSPLSETLMKSLDEYAAEHRHEHEQKR
ncbi:Phosphatidylinositol-4-phosphate 5-kinase [Exophiala dermatitidis]|uniref:1-phosphatidylinositol-4-phosphate 5-kinase n=1 Tax=Exophiala dermatitidis TaxID=5970 RepID=A0AAN6EZ68_EXODE|nr:Phosphatidylinositol-4-phosphate 5-kinase [Exophiala dermatitidis]KAJ4525946.1 Phosphatidylinositol-4-phosphate 5-kinase [Exophiala dermatitidis]KAJ4532825.1 Phosphatidylinositol-4-phosphate 5-kinase [Exophiala dermatitidis]KAJ8994430.1 Phosphatidylinositol-4-phosphate 5-kinase [Exophiala dermatitidis]